MERIKITFLLFLLLGLTNCSTSFFTLTPDEESKLLMGRKEVEREDQFVYTSLSFENNTQNEFIFNLYLYNKGENKLTIDPSKIYCKVFNEKKQLILKNKLYAIDPEQKIAMADIQIIESNESHDFNTGLNIVFGLVNTIVDLTDDEDNDFEEIAENIAIFTDNQNNEEISHNNEIEYLKGQKDYWQNMVLRKTDLNSNEEISGNFYLPIVEEARFIKVYVPVGKSIHTFKFKQIEY